MSYSGPPLGQGPPGHGLGPPKNTQILGPPFKKTQILGPITRLSVAYSFQLLGTRQSWLSPVSASTSNSLTSLRYFISDLYIRRSIYVCIYVCQCVYVYYFCASLHVYDFCVDICVCFPCISADVLL